MIIVGMVTSTLFWNCIKKSKVVRFIMPHSDPASADPPQLSVILRPHRSLGSRGFLALMLLFGGVSFAAGVAFSMLGAWPVLGFFGLDVALLYLAFRASYRSGEIYETIEISRELLSINRVAADGNTEVIECNPYWARVQLLNGRGGRTALGIGLHGRVVPIGSFLNDEERRSLATALGRALDAVRQTGLR